MKLSPVFTIACTVAVLTAGSALADLNTAASPGNPVIASGTGLSITRGDLDDALAGSAARIQSLTPAQAALWQREVLTNLINTRLLLAKATDGDKTAGQKAADLRITADIENIGSKEAFDQLLKTNGLTEAGYRERLADDNTANAVLQRELNVDVSDDDVQKYYDAHTADFEQPQLAHISHILILTVDPVTQAALPDSQLLARRRLAEQVVKLARTGDDFEKLAKQVSEDPGTKANGGELPPFPRGEMAPEIDAAAFSMTNNEVSDVITTGVGYQIVKLLNLVPAAKTSYLTAAGEIKQLLTRQKYQELAPPYLEGLRSAAIVQILDPNLKVAAASQ